MKKIYTIVIFLSLLTLILSGITIRFEESFNISNLLFLIGGITLMLVTVAYKKENTIIKTDFLFMIYIFTMTLAVYSSLYNQDYNSFVSIIKLLLMYLFTVIFIFNNSLVNFNMILYSFLIACVITILYSIITVPYDAGLLRYKGVFENPNSMGMLSATMFTITVALFHRSKEKAQIVLIGFLLVSLLFVFNSGSRTSFLTVLGISCVVIVNYILNSLREKRIPKINMKHSIIILLLIVCFVIFVNNDEVYKSLDNNILNKFSEKADNITSSRTEIWRFAFINSGITGKGSEFIKDNIGFSAHNSFLAIMMEYGWFVGFLYITFWLIALIKSLLYGVHKKDLIPILFITNYIFLSMMEVLTVHISSILAMVGIGYLVTIRYKETKVEEI